ncbi:hypothetical protein LQ948_01555 [Jiella sp. MQZ9-1]|uniref:Chemotaxis protein MotC n=1 Tax=Jiella flava TaxID=2816857 RepID=A0A939FUW9_9HYPH|nr:hypothetical protein [Jiella flava]MBO0661246.1 hypothetical protein [Jiella flava]MCD2469891.1 hypothetical protein [Jiella flava]
MTWRRLDWLLALVATVLVLVAPARAKDAPSAGPSDTSAEAVRQAGEDARMGEDPLAHAPDQGPQTAMPGTASDAADGHGDAPADGAGSPETESNDAAGHGNDAHVTNSHPAVPVRGPQPYEVIRSLQFLQDQAARGNPAANRVQARLLQWYGPSFEHASNDVWKDPRNQRAAALFVLSGGPPSVLRMIIARNAMPESVMPLLKGALAYVENRQKDAETLLSGLDIAHLEPGLGAQVNLALAQLLEKEHPKQALERLRLVMLEGTGTLLEEAALRLAMVLADQLGEHDRADNYARLYFDRYDKSIYAGNFRARFSAIYVARPASQANKTLATVADAVARIPADQQIMIYLSIGRRSLIAGNMKLAGAMGEKVLGYANLSDYARQRARLYVAASTLTERDPAEMLASLQSIDRDKLHPADRKLYDAALGVLNQIRKPLMAVSRTDKDAAPASEAAFDSAVVDRANKLLNAVRGDLKESGK